jgi:hypothetical protein
VFDGKAEYFAVRWVTKVPITGIVRQLPLAVPNRFSSFGPVQSAVVRGAEDEEIVEFAEGFADPSIIVDLAPIGETLLR